MCYSFAVICSLSLEVNFKSETGGSKVNRNLAKIGSGMRTGNGSGTESGKNFIVNSKADADRMWEKLTGGRGKKKTDEKPEKRDSGLSGNLLRLPGGILRRTPKKAYEIEPETLTDAMLLILNNWSRVARNLSENKKIFREEILRNRIWIFQVKWMIEALINEFPDLIQSLYARGEEQAGLNMKRMRSSVTSIMAQSLEAFKIMGFVKDVAGTPKSRPRSYSISSEFSFEELRKIYKARKTVEKIDSQEIEGLIEGKGIGILVIDGKKKIFSFKESFEVKIG